MKRDFAPGRTLLMLRSISRAHRLDPNNPELHSCLVRFLRHTAALPPTGTMAEVVNQQSSRIFPSTNAEQLNSDYLARNARSLPHLLQAARMLYLLNTASQARALGLLLTNLDDLEGVDLPTCTRILECLRNGDLGPCDDAVAEFTAKSASRFAYATAFQEATPADGKPAMANHQDKDNSVNN